jgi:hypothetical protein
MGKATATSNNLLLLMYNATPWATVAINATSSPLTNIYAALHTADPGAGGTQSSNEIAYTGYARAAIARTSAGFTVTTNSVALAALVGFPAGTGGSGTATHWSTGVASSGATAIWHSGPLGAYQGPFASSSTANTITVPAVSGVVVGSTVVFATLSNSTLPTGLTAGTTYFVKTIGGDQITLAATSGGTVITLSADGSGAMWSTTGGIVCGNTITPQLSTGTTLVEY